MRDNQHTRARRGERSERPVDEVAYARGHGGEGNEKVYERLVWYSGSGSGGEGVR